MTSQGRTVRVDALTSTTPEGHAMESFQWDFGDGSMAEDETSKHTYAELGRFTITLRIVDDRGLTAEATGLVVTRSEFLRGDCNADGTVDISDAVSTLGSLFLGDRDPGCDDACDSNDDGAVDISDAIATLGVLFLGNGVIPLPGMAECGVDPTEDGVGCETFSQCP